MREGREAGEGREGGEKPDAVEVWAVRTGRFLGAVALLGLALYLVIAYAPR